MNPSSQSRRPPFPPWMKKRVPAAGKMDEVRGLLSGLRLATVCQSARCPNLCECFSKGTATFMILGNVCTRDCRFCAVGHGPCEPPDPGEPDRVAEAAAHLKLAHVVVTSVTRDDLPDGGAAHFRRTILAIRLRLSCRVEVLTPDFRGDAAAIAAVASALPDVYNHNVETVPRLYPSVRPAADYERSLRLLRSVKSQAGQVTTKSGIMLGLGETKDEVMSVLRDLREAGCGMITIGQYLQPTPAHLPIERFVPPQEFAALAEEAAGLGFTGVSAGPFVRSSYHAGGMFDASREQAAPSGGRSGMGSCAATD